MRNVISIDPGKEKCGLLLADIEDCVVLDGKVVKSSSLIECIKSWEKLFSIELILLGNGTTSKSVQSRLLSEKLIPFYLVEEARTTLRAKERYYELFPPNLIFKLLPKTLLFPPKNLDAVVSLILIEDYFHKRFEWKGSADFKTLL